MERVYEIRTPAQLRVLNAPSTRAVYEAMLDASGGVSAAWVAQRCDISPETAHYHLRKLIGIGLAQVVGEQGTGARPEKLFALTARRLELRRGKRSKPYRQEMARGVRLLARLGEREYARAVHERQEDSARISRCVGWLTGEQIERLRAIEQEVEEIFAQGEQESDHAGRERFARTMILAPVE